jgi:hypothetical protein
MTDTIHSPLANNAIATTHNPTRSTNTPDTKYKMSEPAHILPTSTCAMPMPSPKKNNEKSNAQNMPSSPPSSSYTPVNEAGSTMPQLTSPTNGGTNGTGCSYGASK